MPFNFGRIRIGRAPDTGPNDRKTGEAATPAGRALAQPPLKPELPKARLLPPALKPGLPKARLLPANPNHLANAGAAMAPRAPLPQNLGAPQMLQQVPENAQQLRQTIEFVEKQCGLKVEHLNLLLLRMQEHTQQNIKGLPQFLDPGIRQQKAQWFLHDLQKMDVQRQQTVRMIEASTQLHLQALQQQLQAQLQQLQQLQQLPLRQPMMPFLGQVGPQLMNWQLQAAALHTPPKPATNQPKPSTALSRAYRDLNLKVIPETRPAFNDANLVEKPKKLGEGTFNSVFEVKLRSDNGAITQGVFKPLNSTDDGWVTAATGIPWQNPQIAMRNIATGGYAKALGFDVIAETRVAFLSTPTAPGEPGTPGLGLLMEKAAGQAAASLPAETLQLPAVVREVTKLQLLDHLTGQGDRHANNYFVHVGPNDQVKVTGIDNDQCFGARLTDPEGIRFTGDSKCGFRGTRLPPVVDTDMAFAIMALTPEKLQEMLGNKLSPSEINAANLRLSGVKEHIAKLDKSGAVILPHQWDDKHLISRLDPDNSYVGREQFVALHNADQW